MSFSPESGAVPNLPVAGSTSGIVAPLTESTSSPPLNFEPWSCQLEVGEDQGEDVETLQQKVVADGQWRQEAQHVAVGAAGQHDDAGGVRARAQLLGEVGVGFGGSGA